MIHPTALIDSACKLEEGVEIGPFCRLSKRVKVGKGTRLRGSVFIEEGTEIGEGCDIGYGCVLGAPPEDLRYKGKPSYLRIGDGNILREYVTVHKATEEGEETRIGDNNYIMAYVHIAHNCRIGNNTIITNGCQLAGYVELDDYAVLGGMVGIHQFCRVGKYAMIGAYSYLDKDMPPFLIGRGNPVEIRGVNLVALRRYNFSEEKRRVLKEAYRIIFRQNLPLSRAIAKIEENLSGFQEIEELLEFLKNSKRGIPLRREK